MTESSQANLPPREQRTELLIGSGGLARLRQSTVLVFGLGGVGGHAAEALARAGVGHLILADGDTVEATNLNRQLIALESNCGMLKTAAWRERLLAINPELQITSCSSFIKPENVDELLTIRPDAVAEAIDTLQSKVAFIQRCFELEIPLISSMGSGGRLDPSLVREGFLHQTENCALARSVRRELRKNNFKAKLPVIWSPELVDKNRIKRLSDHSGGHASVVGTISYMPAIFGLFMAGAVIRHLLGLKLLRKP